MSEPKSDRPNDNRAMSRWLESRVMRVVFGSGAWTVVFLIVMVVVFALLAKIHPKGFEVSHGLDVLLQALIFPTGALVIINVLIVSFGMAAVCVWRDDASTSVKTLWLVCFFFAWPLGSALYYFTVYRKLSARNEGIHA